MDVAWWHLKDTFLNLTETAQTVIVVPHSNAAYESVFSMIKKNKTEFRSNLQLDGSLNSIVGIKMASPKSLPPCHEWKPSDQFLKLCKSATIESNEEYRNKKLHKV